MATQNQTPFTSSRETAALVVDESGLITGVSEHVCAATGRQAAELLGTPLASLFSQYRRAQEADRLRSEFFSGLSHELRSPLNGIIGFAELMRDGTVGAVTAEHREFLDDILTSARQLQQLINDVLELTRGEAEKPEARPEPMDPVTIMAEVCEVFRNLALRNCITTRTQVEATLGQLVIDSDRFKQVLYNYLSNALKSTREGGQVTVRLLAEGTAEFRLEVEESSPLTDKGEMPDSKIRQTATDILAPTLGMASTRWLVQTLGGHAGVRTNGGQGRIFFAVLPRITALSPTIPERPAQPPKPLLEG